MSFDRVAGHAEAREHLARAVSSRRLAHAYLFVGDEGIGKRTLAIELARLLVCETFLRSAGAVEDTSLSACGSCGACKRVERGSHPDVLVSPFESAGGSVKIGEVRVLEEFLQRKALEGGYKALIVDGAEEMTEAAANAFLKTLEEPPPHSLLVLVAQSTARLPQTVASRCQVVRLHPLEAEAVRELLESRHLVPAPEAEALAAISGGSPGRALGIRGSEWLSEAEAFTRDLTDPRAGDPVELAVRWHRAVRPTPKTPYNEASARLQSLLLISVRSLRACLRRGMGLSEEWMASGLEEISGAEAKAVLQSVLTSLEYLDRKAHLELLLEDLFLRARDARRRSAPAILLITGRESAERSARGASE